MFTAIKLFLGKYVYWILAFVILGLVTSSLGLGYLYRNALERNAQLEYSLAIQTAEVKNLRDKIDMERVASERLQKSLSNIDKRHAALMRKFKELQHDPQTSDLTNESVISVLCETGLADKRLCKK
jgi:hypothetical protein